MILEHLSYLLPVENQEARLTQRLRARAVVLQLRAEQPLEQLALPRALLLAARRLLRRRSTVRLQCGHLGHAHACMGMSLFLLLWYPNKGTASPAKGLPGDGSSR